MTKHGERCETCTFWNTTGTTHGNSECRRHAPAVMEGPSAAWSPNDVTVWPSTALDDWCGDWQAQHDYIEATRKC